MNLRDLRRALEAELAAQPDDLATHAAYADLLDETGDPRGEFIQTQLMLEGESDPARRRELRRREAELLVAHQAEWLGGLGPLLLGPHEHDDRPQDHAHRFSFRRGWLETLEIGNLNFAFARALARAPIARLLRELVLDNNYDDSRLEDVEPEDNIPPEAATASCTPGVYPLMNSPSLANVRVFQLGIDEGDDYHDFRDGTVIIDAVPRLVRSMPRLEELRLFAWGFDVGELFLLPTLTHLRILQLNNCNAVYRLDLLAHNTASSNLTELLCHPHHIDWSQNQERDEASGFREEDGYIPLSVVVPLFQSPRMHNLRHLRLRVSSMGDEGCKCLVESGMLARLKRLDLRHGRITDAGALMLWDCPDTRKLEWLDLGANSLTEGGVTLIRGLGIPGRVDAQHDEGDEEQYLTEGDFE